MNMNNFYNYPMQLTTGGWSSRYSRGIFPRGLQSWNMIGITNAMYTALEARVAALENA